MKYHLRNMLALLAVGTFSSHPLSADWVKTPGPINGENLAVDNGTVVLSSDNYFFTTTNLADWTNSAYLFRNIPENGSIETGNYTIKAVTRSSGGYWIALGHVWVPPSTRQSITINKTSNPYPADTIYDHIWYYSPDSASWYFAATMSHVGQFTYIAIETSVDYSIDYNYKVFRYSDTKTGSITMELTYDPDTEAVNPMLSNTGRFYLSRHSTGDSGSMIYLDYFSKDDQIQSCAPIHLPANSPVIDWDEDTSKLIVDDGGDTIIFNRIAYSHDAGQTWAYYDEPLPAAAIVYANGVFQCTTFPATDYERVSASPATRYRSYDRGLTWQEEEFHEISGDTKLEAIWHPDIRSTELKITSGSTAVESEFIANWQLDGMAVLNGRFLVSGRNIALITYSKEEDGVWVEYSDYLYNGVTSIYAYTTDAITIPNYYDLLIEDGNWEIEFVNRYQQTFDPCFIRINESNRDLFKLFTPSGRAYNTAFGMCYVASYPWLYNQDLGAHAYFKAPPTPVWGSYAFYLWKEKEGWLYSTQYWYPFLWSYDRENWIWIDAGEGRTHWWFLYQGNDQWQNLYAQ